eukprot:2696441-Rhodomonas_salina.1
MYGTDVGRDQAVVGGMTTFLFVNVVRSYGRAYAYVIACLVLTSGYGATPPHIKCVCGTICTALRGMVFDFAAAQAVSGISILAMDK